MNPLKSVLFGMFFHLSYGIGLASFLVLIAASNVKADSTPGTYNEVTITDVIVSIAPSGGKRKLRFRLTNETAENLTLIGITSQHISDAAILAQTSHSVPVKLSSFPILTEETLDLYSSHLKIELSGLEESFVSGTIVPLTLNLLRGGIPIFSHVH